MSINPEHDAVAGAADNPPESTEELRATVERLTSELAAAQAKSEEHWNNALRAMADADNARKRAQRDVESAHRFAVERFAGDLLDVRDSLELGIAAGGGDETNKLVEGMAATLRLLNKAFEKAGITVIDPSGQAFNPEFHEAMATQPLAEPAPNTVVAVVQKGYALNGRLLRPARVIIARAPEAAS